MMSEVKTILLIDDDADLVAANTLLLESKGYQIVSTTDGSTGVTKAREHKPDLILLDVMMGHDTEGFEVARELKEIPELSGTPVILLTGIRRDMKLPFAFEPDEDWLPVHAILEKPIPPEQLLDEVKKALAG
jgi:two-component system alkaline phosphatase synthesis response regulator PhoP